MTDFATPAREPDADVFRGASLRRLRLAKGYSEEAVARRLGLSGTKKLAAFEDGTEKPTPPQIARLRQLLGDMVPRVVGTLSSSHDEPSPVLLRARRKFRGLLDSELALWANISPSTYQQFERGQRLLAPKFVRGLMGVLDAVEELPVLEVTGPALTGWRDDNDKSLEGLAADLGIDAYVLRSYEAHGGPSNMVRNLARAVTFSPNRLRRVAPYMIARLTRLRQRHGLTQRDLADRLGLPQAFVMALESGGVTPSDSLLDRLEVLLPLPDDMVAELASIRLTSLYLGDPEMDKWPEAEQRTAEEPDTEDPDQTDAADEKPLDVLVSVAPPAALYDGPVRIAAPVGSGEEFKARRESKGLTQRELSQFVALSSTALSIFESGRKFLPPQEETMLLSVMDALADVPVADCTGLRLAQRREAARLTAEELAFRAGVESDLIPLLEARGAESAPRHVVRRLARALSPDADALAAATGPALTKRLRTHGWTLERLAELWRVPPALVEAFEAGDMSPSTALVQELEQAMVRAAKLEPDTTEVSPGARSSGEGSSTGLEVIIPNAPPPKRKGIKLLDFCGDQLRQRRETAGFTLESLAAQTGLAYGRLYGYEVQGLIPPPDVARKLAKVLSSETP